MAESVVNIKLNLHSAKFSMVFNGAKKLYPLTLSLLLMSLKSK